MHFVIYCLDKPDSADLRLKTREAHLAYVSQSGAAVRAGGALFAEDGETMVGSMLILEAESLSDAEAWSANDPYRKAGLFEKVDVRPWRWLIDNYGK